MAKPKGIPNKRTQLQRYRAQVKETLPAMQAATALATLDYVGESLACMASALKFFSEYATQITANPKATFSDKRAAWLDVVQVGAALAPYRYPKLSTIKVAEGGNKTLVPAGASSAQIIRELAQLIQETGVLPDDMIDITPQRGLGD